MTQNRASKSTRFGKYEGVFRPMYDGWIRSSQYVAVRDGTRLAVDLFLPTADGAPSKNALPAVWGLTAYHRAFVVEGRIHTMFDPPLSMMFPSLPSLMRNGYAVVVVDTRGTGASFGTWDGMLTDQERDDAYDMTEWIAAQPWCDGMVGMLGLSYLAMTQYLAASANPPHLRAVFPRMAPFDLYDFVYPGGVFREDMIRTWDRLRSGADKMMPAAPVDEDKGQALLRQAVAEHAGNRSLFESLSEAPYRDSRIPGVNVGPYAAWSLSARLDAINRSEVAVYIWDGWHDAWSHDAILWFRNLQLTKKLTMGPWPHNSMDPIVVSEHNKLLASEQLRWFDHWLKGIDTGIMDDPPIHYASYDAEDSTEWRSSFDWPPRETTERVLLFSQVRSGTIESAHDGSLVPSEKMVPESSIQYKIDYSATTGSATRWDNTVAGQYSYPDMTPNDAKGVTFTSEPLREPLSVIGHPIVDLEFEVNAVDLDIHVHLEDVDESRSRYVTEGVIRASHRAESEAPFDNLGLPYRSGECKATRPLVRGHRVKIKLAMLPISWIFEIGHKIRLTVTGTDQDNAPAPAQEPPPVVVFFVGSGGSKLRLSIR